MKTPRFIQRIICEKNKPLRWDDMDAEEFNSTTLDSALAQMKHHIKNVHIFDLGHFEYEPVTYVGLEENMDLAAQLIREELALPFTDAHGRRQHTQMDMAFRPGREWWERTAVNGWLTLNYPAIATSYKVQPSHIHLVPFAIFLDSHSGDEFMDLLESFKA